VRLSLGSLIGASLIAVLVTGCGGSDGLLPATGTVTYKGQPVEGASVSFQPEGPGAVMGIGTTDASGKYEIHTAGKPGAKPGKHLVAITKQVAAGGGASASAKPEDMKAMYQKSKGGQALENQLPAKYANPSQGGLSADVQSGKSVFDFTLSD
jgi:hypothetical protein